MSQSAPQGGLFRFRCPECRTRLKVDGVRRGKAITCPKCEKTVMADRRHTMEVEELNERVAGTDPEWVKTKCECGRVIRAPIAFAGRTGACPHCAKPVTMPVLDDEFDFDEIDEASTFVQSPMEDTLGAEQVQVQPQELPKAEGLAKGEIKYSRVTPVEKATAEPQYLRAACLCGAEVHANVNMGGKTVPCPKCESPIVLPYRKTERPVFDFDAMGQKDLDFQGESEVFQPHMVSAGKNVFEEIDPEKEWVAQDYQEEWDAEKRARALNIHSLRGASAAEMLYLSLLERSRAIKETLWGDTHSAMVTASVVLVLGVIVLSVQVMLNWDEPGNELPKMQSAHKVRFYDLESGTFFRAPSDTLPPAVTPSQAGHTPGEVKPAGVRVYVFSCKSCSDAESIFPVLLEDMTADTQAGFALRMRLTGVPRVPELLDAGVSPVKGRLVSRPSPVEWVEAGSMQGQELIEAAKRTKCEDGADAQWCRDE